MQLPASLARENALAYGFRVIAKLRLFPKTRQDWLRAFLFVFRAYVVVGVVGCWFVYFFWVYRQQGGSARNDALVDFCDFEERVMTGYAVCLVVLAYRGIADLIRGRWRSGLLNLFLAAISAWVIFTPRPAIA